MSQLRTSSDGASPTFPPQRAAAAATCPNVSWPVPGVASVLVALRSAVLMVPVTVAPPDRVDDAHCCEMVPDICELAILRFHDTTIVTPLLIAVAFSCRLPSVPTVPPVLGNAMEPRVKVPDTLRLDCVRLIEYGGVLPSA